VDRALIIFEDVSRLKKDSKKQKNLRKKAYSIFFKSEKLCCLSNTSKVKDLLNVVEQFVQEGQTEFFLYFDDRFSKDYVRNVIPEMVSKAKEKFLDVDFHYSKISTREILSSF
jgi:vacuolar-type H+-ATPase subunit B/Vma2